MATIRYSNQSATRNQPVSEQLYAVLLAAANAAGIDVVDVYSGGQSSAAEGGARTGSTRHDHGGAADIRLIANGRELDFNNPADLPIIQRFVTEASAGGATGIGAGEGYMGTRSLHVGFGSPAVWGEGGSSANAPGWLVAAVNAGRSGGGGTQVASAEPPKPSRDMSKDYTPSGKESAGVYSPPAGVSDMTQAPAMQFPILDRIKARMGDRPTPFLDRIRDRLTEFRTNQMERWGGQPAPSSPPVMPPQPTTASQLTPGGAWEAGTMPGIGTPASPQQPPAASAGGSAGILQQLLGGGGGQSTAGPSGGPAYMQRMAAQAQKPPMGMAGPDSTYSFSPPRSAQDQNSIVLNQMMPGMNNMPLDQAQKAGAFSALMGGGNGPRSLPPKSPLLGMGGQGQQQAGLRRFLNALGIG